MNFHDLGPITVILAIGSTVVPIIYLAALYKMAQIFQTKAEAAKYELHADQERVEMKRQLERISDNVNKLLQSIARLQGQRNHVSPAADES